jgi:hypothetical protein
VVPPSSGTAWTADPENVGTMFFQVTNYLTDSTAKHKTKLNFSHHLEGGRKYFHEIQQKVFS